jgi:eukaryotic-like serine/threonine-protein kinase
MDVETVRVLGRRYRLIEPLGKGGMSVVWRAHDEVLDRQVAVKVLAADGVDVAARARIRSEARAAGRLAHPHITSVHDYGEMLDDSGNLVPYVVMELVRGPTLSERLASGRLPMRTALLIGAQVASALAAAHARGLVHRDIKPSNVILSSAGAKVMDFGLAAVAGDTPESGEPVIWGTPAYLAPERLTSGEVVPASDVYALGLLLYRLLTGGPPWKAETVTQMLRAHEYVEPATLPPLEGLPGSIADICMRCLAKQPEDRPSAGEVASVLSDALGGTATPGVVALPGVATEPDTPLAVRGLPVSVAPLAARNGRRRWAPVILGSAAAALGIILLVTFCTPIGRQGSPGNPEQGRGGTTSTPTAHAQLGQATGAPTRPPASHAPTATGDARGGGSDGGPGGGGGGGSGGGGGGVPPTPVDRTVVTPGGTATCRCTGSTAELVDWTPLPGFSSTQVNPGPAPTVSLVFDGVVTDVRISFRCRNGTPVPRTQVL